MKKLFILEDDTLRISKFKELYASKFDITFANSAGHAKVRFTSPEDYDAIFFDHDLGGLQMVDSSEYNTGHTFAKWLIEYFGQSRFEHLTIVVHSLNQTGAWNIYALFKDWHKDCHLMPYHLLIKNGVIK